MARKSSRSGGKKSGSSGGGSSGGGSRSRSQRDSSREKRGGGGGSGAGGGGGRGFEFRDRTGKVHGRAGAQNAAPRPAAAAVPAHGKPERRPEHREPQREQRRVFGKRDERREDNRRFREHKRDERERKHGPRAGPAGEMTTLRATVDKNRKGFGFLIFEKAGYEDAFVPPRDAERLFHGDRVQVTINGRGEVMALKVVEHRFREVVGRFSPHPMGIHRGGFVTYERKRAREEIFIPEVDRTVKSGDWIRAKLQFHEKGPFAVTAAVSEVYGPELPASADIEMVAAEYNLVEAHSPAAVAEAKTFRLDIPGKDLDGRRDLRGVPFITIDGETARDFDDAIYVEKSKHGYILWVAIADVSHYVTHGTALDTEARSRGTSVYFPEKAFHMLPRELSENLCSLRPKEPRLAMVAKMAYDFAGVRTSTEIMEAVIESRRRATYNQIQAEWEEQGKNPEWEYAPHFELYQLIRKTRAQRGSIDFDLPESEVRVDDQGEVLYIKNRARLDAHRLIEEFMIAANEAVTVWMMERDWPFVYRIHEEPSMQSLLKFQDLAATVGVHIALDKGQSPKVMADFVRTLEGHPAQQLLNSALLRSMRQAVYSSTHGIHYGLASEAYTHFTSPIRRYPDLVVHRMIRYALQVEAHEKPMPRDHARQKIEEELSDICEHCSYRERLASDAERESIKLKQVRIMTRHLGDEFEGKITGMMDMGFFVQIPDPFVEGMVSKETLTDDFYEFNEDRMIFYGRRKKRTFKVGDVVKIRVLRASIDERKIDFGLL